MIRALGQNGNTPVVLLGLESQNLARLRGGQPIRVNLHNLDPSGQPTDLPDIDVVIFFAGKEEIAKLKAVYERRGD